MDTLFSPPDLEFLKLVDSWEHPVLVTNPTHLPTPRRLFLLERFSLRSSWQYPYLLMRGNELPTFSIVSFEEESSKVVDLSQIPMFENFVFFLGINDNDHGSMGQNPNGSWIYVSEVIPVPKTKEQFEKLLNIFKEYCVLLGFFTITNLTKKENLKKLAIKEKNSNFTITALGLLSLTIYKNYFLNNLSPALNQQARGIFYLQNKIYNYILLRVK